MKLNSCSTKDYENKSGLLTTAKQTQSNPILEGRSDYSTAGDEVVIGVIKDKSLAGTGSELRLVEFDGHRLFIYFGELAGMRIDIGANLSEELTADNKLFGDKGVYLICADGAGTYLFPCAKSDGVFLCIYFAHVKRLAGGEANTSSLTEGEIGDSFMFGNFTTLHISYVAGPSSRGVSQGVSIVSFTGKT
jgi:hypothetical protein